MTNAGKVAKSAFFKVILLHYYQKMALNTEYIAGSILYQSFLKAYKLLKFFFAKLRYKIILYHPVIHRPHLTPQPSTLISYDGKYSPCILGARLTTDKIFSLKTIQQPGDIILTE